MAAREPSLLSRAISVRQVELTTAFVAATVFVLCWSASVLPGSVTPNYVRLFTSAPPASSRAMIEGVVWSILAGYAIGGLFAGTYNMLGAIRRKK